MDSNQLLLSRLDSSSQALNQLLSIAQDFATQMTAAQASQTLPQVLASQAQSSLQSAISALSTTFAGEYVFSGIQSNTQPVPNYPGSPPSAGKQAVDASFLAKFGILQSDPSVNSISATDMTSYLNNEFGNLFNENGWSANFYQGSSVALTARVNVNDTTQSSVTAANPAIAQLIAGLTMVADLGGSNLNTQTFSAVLTKAQSAIGQSQIGIAQMQTQVGIIEAKTKAANDDITTQKNILSTALTNTTSVDQYATATKINELTTQLQTSYSLTSRMQQLSLLQYLPVA